MNRLFVYGIFLDQSMRDNYGMFNAHYATVQDYATVGGQIVAAVEAPGYALTGLLVDVSPKMQALRWGNGADEVDYYQETNTWNELDDLEHNYKRVEILTTNGDKAQMYVAKGGQR